MGRFEFNDEVIDVYRSIPEVPFDNIGRLDLNFCWTN